MLSILVRVALTAPNGLTHKRSAEYVVRPLRSLVLYCTRKKKSMSTDAGSVMNPSASGLIGSIIIIAVLLFFAYFFIAGVLQGGVSGTSISM